MLLVLYPKYHYQDQCKGARKGLIYRARNFIPAWKIKWAKRWKSSGFFSKILFSSCRTRRRETGEGRGRRGRKKYLVFASILYLDTIIVKILTFPMSWTVNLRSFLLVTQHPNIILNILVSREETKGKQNPKAKTRTMHYQPKFCRNVSLVSKMAVLPKQGILRWGCFSKYSKWTNIVLIKSCKEPFPFRKVSVLFLTFP